ncbi:iron-sulfur cluster assembly scaffold protein [Candidatus Uhrbacteria bacterium]|nr:iron-sulfur cluster assembly scaffold protein [Candidatus Uhrbacteria bacterium]
MNNKKGQKKIDIAPAKNGGSGFYSDVVKEHFFKPKNFMEDESGYKADGQGMVGSPACGDVMRVWIQVDDKSRRIKDLKWKTFGCASAIAATSMMSEMVTEKGGMTLEEARALRPQDITERLHGLPVRKIHCSVLGDKALRAAINDYYRKQGETDKVEVEAGRVIDKVLKITDQDIEEAVLDGAVTLEDVQRKTKVGTGDPSCIPEVEQLIRFYREKYFGAE